MCEYLDGQQRGGNMKKSLSIATIAMVCSGAALASDDMIGIWDCTMVSDYGDFEFELMLNDDTTYTKRTDMFGSVSVDSGNWIVEGEELVMNRQKFSKNGEEKDSEIQFRRRITSVSDKILTLKHDEVVTTCTRV
jgi:hypothetical protein